METSNSHHHEPWNKGKLIGQKTPLKLKEIWAIRVRLELSHRTRDLALFNLAIDSKLHACDLVKLKVRDISHGDRISSRAIVMQQKTERPVQFEITEQTRNSVAAWIQLAKLRSDEFLFPSRIHDSPHLSTRQYARVVNDWVEEIGLDSTSGEFCKKRIWRTPKNAENHAKLIRRNVDNCIFNKRKDEDDKDCLVNENMTHKRKKP